MVRKWETTRAEELTQILDSKVTGICSLSEAPITPPPFLSHTQTTHSKVMDTDTNLI